jgi:hypothetical protein
MFSAVGIIRVKWTGSTTGALLEPIGNIPPAEAEARYYAQTEDVATAA